MAQNGQLDICLNLTRLPNNPIIRPGMDERMAESGVDNINGPSLIRVPEWVENPLGRYYLYFAHHTGTYIRMAYADEIAGPWTVHSPGVLELIDSFSTDHIASPDVHVDHNSRQIRMYFHGGKPADGKNQETRVAISNDGLNFEARSTVLGLPYFRVFQLNGWYYAIGMPGTLYRSQDGLKLFLQGPRIFPENQRHTALLRHGDQLLVFYTMVGEQPPESILLSTIDLSDDWHDWKPSEPKVVLAPEHDWEGANQPLEPSKRGIIVPRVNQLRDPAIFEDGDDLYLLYAVAGEQGIAVAKWGLD